MRYLSAMCILACLPGGVEFSFAQPKQPPIGARKAAVINQGGLSFRDLNRNAVLDQYEDWRLSVDQRVADLLSKMTVEEKAGLLVHSSLAGFTGPNGEVLGLPEPSAAPRPGAAAAPPPNRALSGPSNAYNTVPARPAAPGEMIEKRGIRWILVRPNRGEVPEITAKFHNSLQEMAEASRLGIPIVFSTDPRHTIGPMSASTEDKPVISLWPDQIGLAATADAALVREAGRIAAAELRALGIRCLLGPMADTATDPRWTRIPGTFGEDAHLNARLIKAYIEGFQGQRLCPESVLTVTKHFPGDGPTKDGFDPHNSYGKWTIYPGDNFDYHVIPFKAALEAGSGGMMTGYMIPVGKDTVATAFSKKMTNLMLRTQLGFDGLVVTDWLAGMPWGVEKLTPKEREREIFLAGCDQIGGSNDVASVLSNLKDGSVPSTVVDASVRRILKPMFQMGLFENPYVDPDQAKALVASKPFLDAGYAAQLKSTVLLKNANNLLPLRSGTKVYVQNLSKTAAARHTSVVNDATEADVLVIKLDAPATVYPYGGTFSPRGAAAVAATPDPAATALPFGFTLAYSNAANAGQLAAVRTLLKTGKPVVVAVTLTKPVILTEFIDDAAAVLGVIGAGDAALADILFGKAAPQGKLPFDLPRDMQAVMAQAEDLPFDTTDPLFKFGFGLTYAAPPR